MSWNNPLSPVAHPRILHSSQLYLDEDQAIDVPAGLKSETVIIPSTSNPSWSGFFTIDYKEKPTILRNMTLQFLPTTLTATGTLTNYPRLIPAFFFFSRIELVINAQVIDTIYGTQQFLLNQWKYHDQDRMFFNNAAGAYASGVQRNTVAVSASPSYLCNLQCFVDQIKYLCLTDVHNIQLRVYMDSLANVADLGTLTAPVSTLPIVNLLADITRLPSDIANRQLALMAKRPFDSIFHELRYQSFSGITTNNATPSTLVLTSIVGRSAGLFFVVRPTASYTNAGAFNFTAIKNFQLLSSSQSSLVGGQVISSQIALQFLNSKWCRSSYTTETAAGSNLAGTVIDSGANVYFWSFSSDILSAMERGLCLNSFQFTGAESLQINWNSTGTAVTIDVYSLHECYLEQGINYVKKVSM